MNISTFNIPDKTKEMHTVRHSHSVNHLKQQQQKCYESPISEKMLLCLHCDLDYYPYLTRA